MAKKSETALSKDIATAIEKLGFTVLRLQSGIIKSGNRFIHLCPKGTPDRICLGPNGLTIWLEIKLEDGEMSEEQIKWHAKHKALGHHVFMVKSVSEAVEIVKGLMNQNG